MLEKNIRQDIDPNEALNLATQINAGSDSISASLMMREIYETHYYIHDHIHQPEPFGLSLMRDSEDPISGSLILDRMESFAANKVSEYFGLSFLEFISMPTVYVEAMIRIAKKQKGMNEDAVNDSLAELENLQRKLKSQHKP